MQQVRVFFEWLVDSLVRPNDREQYGKRLAIRSRGDGRTELVDVDEPAVPRTLLFVILAAILGLVIASAFDRAGERLSGHRAQLAYPVA